MKKNATVSIPVTTLNALKGLLFNSEEGVDLSPIVKDLTVGDDNEDLMAINVGLTFKGLTPEIDTTTRYAKDYQSLVEYTFISYSLIRDVVTYERRTIANWNESKNDLCPYTDNQPYKNTTSLSGWYNMTTDRAVATKEIVDRFYKEPQKESV